MTAEDWIPVEAAQASVEEPVLIWDGHQCACAVLRHGKWFVADAFGYCEDGEILGVTHLMPLPSGPKTS